jgi:FKBP-type peptidyl-prolyl cis-trans isomerase SlyD
MDRVEPDRAVTMKFEMRSQLPRGTVKKRREEVIEFIFGVERQVPTLERTLHGASVGDKFSLQIPASEIYGDHDPTLVRKIPKKGLVKQRLKKGRYYRQMKRGSLISFKVLEIGPNTVLADFNKPMAGISVSMDVEVVAIREASEKEIGAAREAQLKKSIGCG